MNSQCYFLSQDVKIWINGMPSEHVTHKTTEADVFKYRMRMDLQIVSMEIKKKRAHNGNMGTYGLCIWCLTCNLSG